MRAVSNETTTLAALAERMRNRAVQPTPLAESTHMAAEASGTPRAAVVYLASAEAEWASGAILDLNGASYLRS